MMPASLPTTRDQPLRLCKGAPLITRTDVFFNFNIANPEGGNPFIGCGKLDGNGIPPDFFSDVHVRKALQLLLRLGHLHQGCPGWRGDPVGRPSRCPACPATTPTARSTPTTRPSARKSSRLPTWKIRRMARALWDTGFRLQVGLQHRQHRPPDGGRDPGGQPGRRSTRSSWSRSSACPGRPSWRHQRAKTLPIFVSGWLEDIHDPHNWYVPYIIGTYGAPPEPARGVHRPGCSR